MSCGDVKSKQKCTLDMHSPRKGKTHSAILVALLAESIELGNSIVECLLGEVAGFIGGSHDLIVEHAEVQGESETDGMRGWELNVGDG